MHRSFRLSIAALAILGTAATAQTPPQSGQPAGAGAPLATAAQPAAPGSAGASTTSPQENAGANTGINTGPASEGPIGATRETMPSKFSQENDALDKRPIVESSPATPR